MSGMATAAAWATLLAGWLACVGAATATAGDNAATTLPRRISLDGRHGFVDVDGRLLVAPRYALCGDWSEGRLWVQREADGQRAGCFVDETGKPLTAAVYLDLSDILPEMPLPRFERGTAVVGLREGGHGYLDRSGLLLGRAPAAGAFQRQDDDLLLFVSEKKLGFMNRRGEISIPARYEEATPFRGGRAAARLGEHWGLIDLNGLWVGRSQYDEMLWFADEPRFWMYRQAQRWGVIDRLGQVVAAAHYDDFGVWQGDTVSVRLGGLWGLLAADGQLRVPPAYRSLTPFGEDSTLWAALADHERWGVIDGLGKVVVVCRFEAVQIPNRDLWLAQQEGLWGILNRTNGAWLAAVRYQRIMPLEASFAGLALAEAGGRWGVIETATGKERIAPRFDMLQAWHNWLAAQESGWVRLIGADGREAHGWEGSIEGLPAPESMMQGVGVLRTAAGCNLIDTAGNRLWRERLAEAGAWSGGLLPARRNGAWGYLDRAGAWVITPRFAAAGAFAEGWAPVCEEGLWGLINRRGDYLVKPAFEALGRPWRGLAPAKRAGRWGLIDRRGQEVLPLEYDDIEWGE